MSNRKQSSRGEDQDDWETDPDYIRNMDETDQRWGSRRTCKPIDMTKLIDDVRREHKELRDKLNHPSQRDYSGGFGGKYGIQKDRQDKSAFDYTYTEKSSKHSSQEVIRQVTTSGTDKKAGTKIEDAKRAFLDRDDSKFKERGLIRPERNESSIMSQFASEEKSSSLSSNVPSHSTSFKSVQNKFNALQKEKMDLESSWAKKSELSKTIKSSTKPEERMFNSNVKATGGHQGTASPTMSQRESSIKSLSEKFESMISKNRQEFEKKIEERRKEFQNEIDKKLGPFGDDRGKTCSPDRLERRQQTESPNPGKGWTGQKDSSSPTGTSFSNRRLAESDIKPKVYTQHEVSRENYVSRVIKENDKILVNESKRNVERSSSCHGSSDEESPQSAADHLIGFKAPILRKNSPTNRPSQRSAMKNDESASTGLMARTLFDYEATEDDELSFDVDELITNIEKLDPGWYKGTIALKNGKKKEGLFPANYVELLNDTEK